MPSAGKPKHRKPAGKTSRKKSELDSALGQISDESIAATKEEFQDLLGLKATLASSSGKMQRNSNGVSFS